MTTKKLSRKEALKAQLAAILDQEKRDHASRINALGTFLFPPDDLMEGEPVAALTGIANLITRQPVEALDKLIEYATKKRDDLAVKTSKKTAVATPKPARIQDI